jgi:tetratricopeptide (TPR) repeat protein
MDINYFFFNKNNLIMKNLFFSILAFSLINPVCSKISNQNENKFVNQSTVVQIEQKSALDSIQFKIYNSFVKSIIDKSTSPLNSILGDLTNLYRENPNNTILYWEAYLLYYKAIYYLKINDKSNSEKTILEGIDIFKVMQKKNSEDYALFAMLQSFSIQFASGIKASEISGEVKKNLEFALDIDPSNLRANYVYASNDFYTPVKYGGGKEVEKYLLKAISLPDQKVSNTFLPSWGKEEAYAMLVRFYIEQEKWDLAKKYYQKGAEIFPESYSINQFASKLVGK